MDHVYGRVVLAAEVAASPSAAESAAVASPGVAGDNSHFVAEGVVDVGAVVTPLGNDVNGNALPHVSLPLNPN